MKQKETCDRKHLLEELPIGTEVLLENTADEQRKGGKLNPAWLGLYTLFVKHMEKVYTNSLVKDQPPLKKQYRQDNENQRKEQSTSKGKGKSRHAPRKQQINEQLAIEILTGAKLTDQHMTFATTLLKQQFPEVDGLQSTLLSQINAFRPVGRSDHNSIQLHHTGQFHWVMSASVSGKIYLYDSKFSGGPLSSSLQVQLSLIYNTSIGRKRILSFFVLAVLHYSTSWKH